MSKIHAVLLVPEPNDPHGLLAEGPCGARPPIAYIPNRGWKWTEGPCAEEFPTGRALVLAWDGEPVAEALTPFRRTEGVTREWASVVVVVALAGPSDPDFRDYVGDHELPGTLVLLDAEGREVRHED